VPELGGLIADIGAAHGGPNITQTPNDMATTTPYIPASDSGFSDWLLNFFTLINATPTNYGLIAGDATAIGTVNTNYQAAYLLATNPTTRTAPNVAAKDVARAAAESVCRPYAIQVRNNDAVSDALKVGLGVTVPKLVPTPVPPPITAPSLAFVALAPGVLTYSYTDAATPVGKSKPFGVTSMIIWRLAEKAAPADPDVWQWVAEVTKSPNRLDLLPEWRGKEQTIRAQWATRSGPGGQRQFGPWSVNLTFIAA
jgi:hypothetical protein